MPPPAKYRNLVPNAGPSQRIAAPPPGYSVLYAATGSDRDISAACRSTATVAATSSATDSNRLRHSRSRWPAPQARLCNNRPSSASSSASAASACRHTSRRDSPCRSSCTLNSSGRAGRRRRSSSPFHHSPGTEIHWSATVVARTGALTSGSVGTGSLVVSFETRDSSPQSRPIPPRRRVAAEGTRVATPANGMSRDRRCTDAGERMHMIVRATIGPGHACCGTCVLRD